MSSLSNSQIDKAGKVLSKEQVDDEVEYINSDEVVDEHRKGHLLPLTKTTLEIQKWLSTYCQKYYIAQRLKRKPQIIRKLRRLSVRLTQLQDVGGARIIVEDNKEVDKLYQHLREKIAKQEQIQIKRKTDYRQMGRDDTGYRALHLILTMDKFNLELQIRSRIQHYWAESIERTSVIYGFHLKEKEGDRSVVKYYKHLSDAFFQIEAGRELTSRQKLELERQKTNADGIIRNSDKFRIYSSHVNEDIIKTLTSIESKHRDELNNWIIVFDWNSGSFVNWDIVGRNPDDAIKAYVQHEKQYSAGDGYEVVLIGSSDVATVRQTHSHYFGIEAQENPLEGLDQAVNGFSKNMPIDTGARQILHCLHRRRAWGTRAVSISTLKNRLCQKVLAFDSSLESLVNRELVLRRTSIGPVSLNLGKKKEIERYL